MGNNTETVKEDVLSFVNDFVGKLPYFNKGEVVLECTNCETHLYGTNRETLHLEMLKSHDFEPIPPQQEKAELTVTCWKCKTKMSPWINRLHEGRKRENE